MCSDYRVKTMLKFTIKKNTKIMDRCRQQAEKLILVILVTWQGTHAKILKAHMYVIQLVVCLHVLQ